MHIYIHIVCFDIWLSTFSPTNNNNKHFASIVFIKMTRNSYSSENYSSIFLQTFFFRKFSMVPLSSSLFSWDLPWGPKHLSQGTPERSWCCVSHRRGGGDNSKFCWMLFALKHLRLFLNIGFCLFYHKFYCSINISSMWKLLRQFS